MSLLKQPEDYGEILRRVFWSTFIVGCAYTLLLAYISPEIGHLLDTFRWPIEIGAVKGLTGLYVLIPFALAVFSRIILLHDKISDALGIRLRFDLKHVLYPIVRRAGLDLDEEARAALKANRGQAMQTLFYRYASFREPVIDSQLVRTAADAWGWYWCALEALLLSIVTFLILTVSGHAHRSQVPVTVGIVLLFFLLYQARVCASNMKPQISEVFADPDRTAEIRESARTLLGR